MIGKMTSGSNPSGLLYYCYYEKDKLSAEEKAKLTPDDIRGELIYIQNLAIQTLPDGRFDMDYLAKQFRDCADQNQHLKNYVWHQSFSFPNGEAPTKEQIEDISTSFARDFGFSENQLVVFRHNDTHHAHFHIVANRINFEGKTTAKDSYSHLRTGTFCREIELEMGLQITPNMKALLPKREQEKRFSTSDLAQSIRQKIDHHLPYNHSFEELKKALDKDGVKMYQKRGVSFLDKKSKAQFKGSDLGREYSLMNLGRRLGQEPMIEKTIEKAQTTEPKQAPKQPEKEIKMDFGMGW